MICTTDRSIDRVLVGIMYGIQAARASKSSGSACAWKQVFSPLHTLLVTASDCLCRLHACCCCFVNTCLLSVNCGLGRPPEGCSCVRDAAVSHLWLLCKTCTCTVLKAVDTVSYTVVVHTSYCRLNTPQTTAPSRQQVHSALPACSYSCTQHTISV
jgi:hypothetical protein